MSKRNILEARVKRARTSTAKANAKRALDEFEEPFAHRKASKQVHTPRRKAAKKK